jgi:hypothetical protein
VAAAEGSGNDVAAREMATRAWQAAGAGALEVEVALASGAGAGGGRGSSPELSGGDRSSRAEQSKLEVEDRTRLQILKNPGTPL